MTDARDPAEVTTIRCPASGCQESWLSNISSDVLPQAVKSHGYQTSLQMSCLRLSRVMAIKHLFRCPASGCQESWLSNISSDVLPQAVKSHGYQTPLQMSCLRLLDIHERTAHPTTAPATAPTATGVKAGKAKRPLISVSGIGEEWTYFKQRWSEYKLSTRLSSQGIILQP